MKHFVATRLIHVIPELMIEESTVLNRITCNIQIDTRATFHHSFVITQTQLHNIPANKWMQINPPGKLHQIKNTPTSLDAFLHIRWKARREKLQPVPIICKNSILLKITYSTIFSCLNFSNRGRHNLLLLRKGRENQPEKLFSWVEASVLCNKLHMEGTLPTFASEEEYVNLKELLMFSPFITPVENYFIGLKLTVSIFQTKAVSGQCLVKFTFFIQSIARSMKQ